jgi:membrane protease YdiL (CAAX protease family)
MSQVGRLARRHRIALYFILTFAVSWGGALLAIGGSGGMQGTTPGSDPRFVFALAAMLAGPATTGVLLTMLLDGRSGLRDFRTRLAARHVGLGWYAVALLTAPTLMVVTLLALSIVSPAYLPGLFTSPDKGSLLLVGLAVGVSAGVFEELGWTGFAIPAVRQRSSVVATGVIVGVWWSAWHLLPNVWSARAAAGELAVPVYLTTIVVGIFAGYLTAYRVLMAWVYERTASVLLAMLMHASFTASLLILNPLNIAGARLATFSFTLAGVVWAVVLFVVRAGSVPGRAGRTGTG